MTKTGVGGRELAAVSDVNAWRCRQTSEQGGSTVQEREGNEKKTTGYRGLVAWGMRSGRQCRLDVKDVANARLMQHIVCGRQRR